MLTRFSISKGDTVFKHTWSFLRLIGLLVEFVVLETTYRQISYWIANQLIMGERLSEEDKKKVKKVKDELGRVIDEILEHPVIRAIYVRIYYWE